MFTRRSLRCGVSCRCVGPACGRGLSRRRGYALGLGLLFVPVRGNLGRLGGEQRGSRGAPMRRAVNRILVSHCARFLFR